jgi:diacylglycerol kinase family enzyme
VNGRVFLNNASLGVYAAILHRREHLYRRWGRGRLAHYWSVIAGLARFRSPLRLKVTVDGEVRRRKTPLVLVANSAYQLEVLGLPGAECIRSGSFALMVAPDCSRLELVLFALRLALGGVRPARDFELFCGSDILVEDRLKRRLVARDGERELMNGPFRFRIRREALEVIVPAS